MVCKKCTEAAMSATVGPGGQIQLKVLHPKKCGCDCQHRLPTVTSILSRARAAHD